MKTKIIKKQNIKSCEEMLTMRLPKNLLLSLTKTAKIRGLTRSNFCRIILQNAIDNK